MKKSEIKAILVLVLPIILFVGMLLVLLFWDWEKPTAKEGAFLSTVIVFLLLILAIKNIHTMSKKISLGNFQIKIPKTNIRNVFWYIATILLVAFGLWFVLAQSFSEPEKKDNWGFTREEYNAQYAQPSNGCEGVFVPVPPTRSGSANVSKYPIISFREEHQKKAGEIFYIKLDEVGVLFVPEEEEVWYTVTMRNTDYPNQFSTFTLKREGSTLYIKDRKKSEERYKGIWSVTLSRDMTFAFRSQSDTRVHVVEE